MSSSVSTNYYSKAANSRTDSTKKTDSSGNVINAVFEDKADKSVSVDDFLNLMIAQLQNQDFTNPVDNSEYLSQLAQFSAMQQMQELAEYSKTNYMASLVGKTVTAAKTTVGGNVNKVIGTVSKISLVDNEYKAYVNGTAYDLNQIMEINDSSSVKPTDNTIDASTLAVTTTGKTKNTISVKWEVPTKDEVTAAGLRYTVYYSKDKNFDTVEDVKSGVCSGDANRSGLTTETITGLDPDTTYFINVVVKDFDGKETVYSKTAATTLAK